MNSSKEFSRRLVLPKGFMEGRHLLAFSGGPDSVFLLEMLHYLFKEDLQSHIELAYVNYHDSAFVPVEENIVYYYKDKYSLHINRVDCEMDKHIGNQENWAREFRYNFFKKVIQERNIKDVITAHHLDDSLETYILQKERRNLPSCYGLKNESRIFSVNVIRPLLDITKEEIYSFLEENKLPFFEDPTNHDTHTRRNIIRKNLAKEEKDILFDEMTRKNKDLSSFLKDIDKFKNNFDYSSYDILDEEKKRRVSFLLSEELVSPEKREGVASEIYEFLKNKRDGTLCFKDKSIYKTYNKVIVGQTIVPEEYEILIEKEGVYHTPFFKVDVSSYKMFNMPSFPFVMRNVRRGDIFSTNIVSKDVYSFIKKQKVPHYLRDIYPVFLKEDNIRCCPFYSDIKKGDIPISFIVP